MIIRFSWKAVLFQVFHRGVKGRAPGFDSRPVYVGFVYGVGWGGGGGEWHFDRVFFSADNWVSPCQFHQCSVLRVINSSITNAVQRVPLATEPGWLADRCSVSQQLGALQTHTTDTFVFISHTTNVLLFKFRCNIFIGIRIIKEMLGSVASGTHCIILANDNFVKFTRSVK